MKPCNNAGRMRNFYGNSSLICGPKLTLKWPRLKRRYGWVVCCFFSMLVFRVGDVVVFSPLSFSFLLCFHQNPTDSPFVQIMRASHVIKGAASNLMCAQLRACAMNLETAASSAANDPNGVANPSVLQPVQARYEELKVAVQNYHCYLQSVGV